MNTSTNNNTERPLGYWLKAADRHMANTFATAFENEGITRRDWRILNVIDGTVASERPLGEHKLHRLIERGWVAPAGDGWALTDDGAAAKERLGETVSALRAKVADAVTPDDYATTIATLEQIARAYGWEEGERMPRKQRAGRGGHGWGPGRGFSHRDFSERGAEHCGHRGHRGHGGHRHGGERGFRHGDAGHSFGERGGRHFDRHGVESDFGPGFGPRFDRSFGADRERGPRHAGEHPHGKHPHGAHRHGTHRLAQRAFERGFDAGFSRGRDA